MKRRTSDSSNRSASKEDAQAFSSCLQACANDGDYCSEAYNVQSTELIRQPYIAQATSEVASIVS